MRRRARPADHLFPGYAGARGGHESLLLRWLKSQLFRIEAVSPAICEIARFARNVSGVLNQSEGAKLTIEVARQGNCAAYGTSLDALRNGWSFVRFVVGTRRKIRQKPLCIICVA